MSDRADEVEKRESAARAAILEAYGTPESEYGVTLFVSHHLQEVDSGYWTERFGVARPEPRHVLQRLELRSHWGDDDELEVFDFTLPGEVTNYVISVRFDPTGQIDDISMES